MGLTVVTILAAIGISAFILYFRELKVSFLISSELEIPHPSPVSAFLQSCSYGPLQREISLLGVEFTTVVLDRASFSTKG